MPNLSDFTDQTRYNTRAANANADLQNQQAQQNQNISITPGVNAPVGYVPPSNYQQNPNGSYSPGSNPALVDQFGNPTSAGILNQTRAGGSPTSYNTQTGQVTATPPPAPAPSPPSASSDAANMQNIASVRATERQAGTNLPFSQTLQIANSTQGNPFTASDAIAKSRQSQLDAAKGYVSIPQYDKNGNITGYSYQEDPQKTLEAQQALQKSFDTQDQNNLMQQQMAQQNQSQDLASQAASQTQPPQTLADLHTQTSATANIQGSQAGFNTFMSGLTPEQQQLMAPIQKGMDAMNSAFDQVQSLAAQNRISSQAIAGIAAQHQQMLLQAAQGNLDANKNETQTFLQNQMDTANQNLQAQRDQSKQWLQFQQNDQEIQMQRDKAIQVADMAFNAAVTGGTFSSSANAAISKAEAIANQNISQMRAQYGLKAVDVDIQYTSDYTKLNNTFMQDMIGALKDYRDGSLDVLGKQFASEDARSQALQKANEDYLGVLNGIAMNKATGIREAYGKVADLMVSQANLNRQMLWNQHVDQRQQQENAMTDFLRARSVEGNNPAALKPYLDRLAATGMDTSSYQLGSVDPTRIQTEQQAAMDNNDKSFALKAAEIAKGNLMKANAPVEIYSRAKQITDQLNRAWDNFDAAVKSGNSAALAASAPVLRTQYSHLQQVNSVRLQDLGGDLAQKDQSAYDSLIANFDSFVHGGGKINQNVLKEMHAYANQAMGDITSQAKTAVKSEFNSVSKFNGQYRNPLNAVTPHDIVDYPELTGAAYENVDNAGSHFWDTGGQSSTDSSTSPLGGAFSPSASVNAPAPKFSGITPQDIGSEKIGSANVQGQPYLLSALQSADQQMFQLTGQHIIVNSSYRTSQQQKDAYARYQSGQIARAAVPGTSFHEKGLAVDVTNWKEAEPYLAQYGLMPLGPVGSQIRGSDPGHFSIGEMNQIASNSSNQIASTNTSSPSTDPLFWQSTDTASTSF